MHPYLQLVRDTLQAYLTEKKTDFVYPDYLPANMQKQQAGVFVSLYDKNHQLRGSIGTFAPTQANIVLEIVVNAISAATKDPRFQPLKPAELKDLKIQLDVLSLPEYIDSLTTLDPQKYGVLVEKDDKKGIMLPNWPGVKTVEQQVNFALKKAGLNGIYGCKFFRFTSTRYT